MEAMKRLRELRALDKLEERIKLTVQPDVRLLQQVRERREALLRVEPLEAAKEDKAGRPR